MKKLQNLLFGSFLAFMIWGCQQDDQQAPVEASFHFLESKFSLEHFDDPFIKENLKVDWDNYTIRPDSLSNALIYQFDTSIKGKLVNDEKQFAYKYQVLGHNQGNAWDFEVIKILANNAAPVKNVTHLDLGEFSGTIHHYDLKGSNTKALAYEKGELVSEMTTVDDKGPTLHSKEPEIEDNGVWLLITVERYTDMYMYRGGGLYEYAYSVHNSTQHEWAFISTGGTHSTYGHEQGDVYHGHHAGPSAPANPDDEHEEEIIFNLEDYPCQSEIIKDALAANSPITDLVMDIFNSDVKPSITIQAYNLNNILEGGNTYVQNGNPLHYFITMNTQRLDVSTDIDIASTAIHESVHALLFYFYQAGSFQSNNGSYAQLVEDFTIHQASFGGDHHQYMQNFVGDIADSLYSWSINNNYLPNNFTEYDTNDSNNYNGLREYLGKLAWNGLTDTTTFELLYPEGTLERQNIIQLINSESLPYENSANPFGTPCD
ncbi:hypothetical protein [Allomuricauda sp. NBRC 101325]|uniref:hypothetical protein n=1 Tax=Allomuricauda sp. NBRC 101325 TaxID=1113758 RepID=UPI0024A428BD|nr:hypothetical protein [Muricauda sp. NBRC 101325]GLU43178.1 hypothetical protein Musp01_08020 [Muricauda sp. NBRC 101325]